MANLEVWRCGECGVGVEVDAVDRAGVFQCKFCGATLTVPAAAAAGAPCEVRLEHAGTMPVAVIKVLAEHSTLRIARDLVLGAPCVVRSDVPQEQAEKLRQELLAAGARASVIHRGGGAPPARVRPPAVPDPIVLGGTPWYEGTEVVARRAVDDAVLARAVVKAASVTLAVPTGGTPVALYLSIRLGDGLPLAVHHNHPLTRSRSLGSALPKPRELYGAFARILRTPLEPGKGLLALRATRDEMTEDLAGVTFALSAPGLRVAYVDDRGGLAATQLATSGFGYAYVLNVPPGRIQITASHHGESWTPATVPVAPDIVTEVAFWR